MRRYLPFVIVGAVALITLGSATILYRAKRPSLHSLPEDRGTEARHVRGPADATVTLDEFGDFQCPPCGFLSGPIKQMEEDYHSRLRVIFHHFPLVDNHPHAMEAALAAEAAGRQGRFWEMHDLLYRTQVVWTKADNVEGVLHSYAAMLRLNVTRFKQDMASAEVRARVEADQEEGKKLGVKNTPTLFLNGTEVPPGSLAPENLRAAVEQAIKATPTPSPR
jgi:protein-disulfide isomerase